MKYNKEEADFLLARKGRPLLLVEAKLSDTSVSPSLKKIQRMLGVPAVQLVGRSDVHRRISSDPPAVIITSADRWLTGLP